MASAPDEKFSLTAIEMAFAKIPLAFFDARGGPDSKTGRQMSRFDAMQCLYRRLRGYEDEEDAKNTSVL